MWQIAFFELLTRQCTRVVYEYGHCEILEFGDVLYNIQRQQMCENFQAAPRDGIVTEYVNILYIKSFEQVKCSGKELYRAKLALSSSDCSPHWNLSDCGIGLFSVYLYRMLRYIFEDMNPRTDYAYRRTVTLKKCAC